MTSDLLEYEKKSYRMGKEEQEIKYEKLFLCDL